MVSGHYRNIIGGVEVVNVKRVWVVCPACGGRVEAIARDGRIKGYCAVAREHVDFDTGRDSKGHFIKGNVPETGRDSKGRFIKSNVPWNA